MEIVWQEMGFRDGAACGISATLVDDWFVGADPTLGRVGIFLEEDIESFVENVSVRGKYIIF